MAEKRSETIVTNMMNEVGFRELLYFWLQNQSQYNISERRMLAG